MYDNTIPIDLNILRGSRAKVFGEFFYSLYPENEYLYVFGIDARNYVKVYKNIIFASRFAYSYAGGTSPLLYYLGSLDNWINPFFNNPKFEYDIEYDRTKDWAYQAIATNVRGFKQNIRNGPSFSLLNLEMRVPIVKVFIKKPIDSDFIANLQIVGFADAGAAWTGFIPGSKENAYNFSTKGDINGPVYVKIDEMRPPYVYGYGYGFRTRLFGYFFRLDFARGVDQGITQKKVYFSLSLDF